MKVGCLQFAPQVGDIDNNLNRADAVLHKANPEDLDLLVLPELAFTGYNFKSLHQISPFLESQGSGISALWARTTALKLNCVVTVGYPEKVDVNSKWPTSPEYYNSVIAVNSDGETIANYRKAFLYYTDETWALEGPEGFYGGFIPELGTATSMGICMDINPYKFEAPWHAFEFAFHCLEVEANLVILTMAWLTREDASLFSRTPNEPDMETLTYWISRLEPLIRSENRDEIIIIFCNRTGIESDAVYAGTSAVIGVKDGEVNVYGILGRGEKDLLAVDTEKPPYAKVVYRPDDQASAVTPVLDSFSSFEGSEQKGSDQTATAKSSSAQPPPKGISTEITQTSAIQCQAQDPASSTAKRSSDMACTNDIDSVTDHNHQEKISGQKEARSIPIHISSPPAIGTPPKDTSPQPSAEFSRFPSDTLLGAPTELRTALARADSPTISMDIPRASQVIAQSQSIGNRHAEQTVEAEHFSKRIDSAPLGHATHLSMLGEAGIDCSQSGVASCGRQRAACDANGDSHILTKLPDPLNLTLKSREGLNADIDRDSSEWLVRETEDEDEIVEIIVRRSSSCLVHGRSQDELKTPEYTHSQSSDDNHDGSSTFIESSLDDTKLNLNNGTSPIETLVNLESSLETPLTAPFVKSSKFTVRGITNDMTVGLQRA